MLGQVLSWTMLLAHISMGNGFLAKTGAASSTLPWVLANSALAGKRFAPHQAILEVMQDEVQVQMSSRNVSRASLSTSSLFNRSMSQDWKSDVEWPKDLYQKILDGSAFAHLKKPVLVSGGAPGADAYWSAAAKKFGDSNLFEAVNLLTPSNSKAEAIDQTKMYNIPENLVNNDRFKEAFEASLTGLPDVFAKARRDSPEQYLRNFIVSLRVEAMFVVAFTDMKSPQSLFVGGGAGMTAAMYKHRFKVEDSNGKEDPANMNLYLFDDCGILKPQADGYCFNAETHHKWTKWNMNTQTLEVVDLKDIPMPKGAFAAIGGTKLSESGKKAVDSLILKWFAPSQDEDPEGDEQNSARRYGVYAPTVALLMLLFNTA